MKQHVLDAVLARFNGQLEVAFSDLADNLQRMQDRDKAEEAPTYEYFSFPLYSGASVVWWSSARERETGEVMVEYHQGPYLSVADAEKVNAARRACPSSQAYPCMHCFTVA